jgi:hypothetical protein
MREEYVVMSDEIFCGGGGGESPFKRPSFSWRVACGVGRAVFRSFFGI